MSGLAGCQARFFYKKMMGFEKKVAGFIKGNRLFGPAQKILLAVSGGADSMALMHVTHALKREKVLACEIICAHVNHQLRGAEADKDQEFVAGQAEKLSLGITVRRVDVRKFARRNKLSIETAGRNLRIESLVDIAKAKNCKVIVTAHHCDDNAETIVQRLSRGTGFRGLGGIWPAQVFGNRFAFVRPLLCAGRSEIVKYLDERGLKWREDSTNLDCRYRRNFIRHQLLPELQQDSKGSVAEQLAVLAQHARGFYRLVRNHADKVWPGLAEHCGEQVVLDLNIFSEQAEAVKVELVRRSLATVGSGERGLTSGHYEKVLELAKQKVGGKKIELPSGFVVCREYDKLVFGRIQQQAKHGLKAVKSIKVKIPGQTRFGNYLIEAGLFNADISAQGRFKAGKTSFLEWFDFDKIKGPLVVRIREKGDTFRPLGLAGEKKVGKFLTTAKVPQRIRRRLLIVADSEKIIWVWPIRMSEEAKVEAKTKKNLELQITDASSNSN